MAEPKLTQINPTIALARRQSINQQLHVTPNQWRGRLALLHMERDGA